MGAFLYVCFVNDSNGIDLLQILLMNKTDLFREKILHSGRHLKFYISSYKGMIERTIW